MSNYLHDTRRYMTGNSIFEQRTDQQQHFQPTRQTHQSHHQTIPLQSNSHIIKTGIPYSNDTNIICSTVNQSIPIGLPPPPLPLTQCTQIHNHQSTVNIQQYSPIIQPFVPPISYRPATQAPNSNFMSVTHCNYSSVTNAAPTVAITTTTTTTTTTTISTINGITTTTIINKNNAVISRRVRIQETNQAQNVSNHQSMHSVQQVNKTSLITKTRQEMNAATTSSSSTSTNLTYKYLPNISSQTQNGK